MDSNMTPISRLIPRSSGDNKIHRSEMETSRTSSSMVGSGSVPPMTPGSVIDARHMDDVRGDDLVSEILRDVENSSPTPRHHPQMSNGGGGVPGGMGGRGGEVEADPMMTQFHPSQYQDPPQEYYQERRQFIGRRGGNGEYEDEEDDRPPIQEIKTRSSEDTDFIGMILDEMKMPLIVAILILGVGSSGLDESLGKIVPWIVNDGKMGIIGLILKAIVGGLVFYALKRIFL